LRKPSRATLAAICSQNPQNYPAYEAGIEAKRKAQTLDSAAWQHMTRLEADRHNFLTMAKTVVRLRDMNIHPRPSSEIILREGRLAKAGPSDLVIYPRASVSSAQSVVPPQQFPLATAVAGRSTQTTTQTSWLATGMVPQTTIKQQPERKHK
jgi:hypothetical protein